MTPVEVLREARELISDPKRWTRGAYARNAQGEIVSPNSDEASSWCASGAIQKCTDSDALQDAAEKAIATHFEALTLLNDGDPELSGTEGSPRPAPVRHRKVLAAFDRAIELAKADE